MPPFLLGAEGKGGGEAMKVRSAGPLRSLTTEGVPDIEALARLFRKRRRFLSPAALEDIIERLRDADPEERKVAEELLMRLELDPRDGRAALILSRCIMEGGPPAGACLRKLARMGHCPLKEALLDCVVRSMTSHRAEAREVLKTYPWEVLLPYLLREVLLDPRQGADLKEEVVRFLREERDSIVSALPPEPTELIELLIEASGWEPSREAAMEILKAWLEARRERRSLLERLGLARAPVAHHKEAR